MKDPNKKTRQTRERGLSERKLAAIYTILDTPTLTAAAKKLGISVRTLHRWLENDEFANAVSKARQERMRLASNRIQGMAQPAIHALVDLLAPETSATVRAQAARVAIQFAYKSFELDELMERLEVVEARLRDKAD